MACEAIGSVKKVSEEKEKSHSWYAQYGPLIMSRKAGGSTVYSTESVSRLKREDMYCGSVRK